MIPRMRSIKETAAELRQLDPNTGLTEYRIRHMVLDGTSPHVKAGNKRLINLDILLEYLESGEYREPLGTDFKGQIRQIRE